MTELANVDIDTGEILYQDGASRGLQIFKPDEARARQVAIDAGLEYAAKTRDTRALEIGAEETIQHAANCVTWWQQHVAEEGRPRRNRIRTDIVFSVAEAESVLGFKAMQLSRWSKRLKDREKFKFQVAEAAAKKVLGAKEASRLLQQSLSNEHYTPAKYVEAARTVLGNIDLDPATSDEAQKVVKATEFFTAKRSGLDLPWHGRVWMNPPYGSLVPIFIDKLMSEIRDGRVSAAIVLVNAHCTDTAWFQNLWDGLLCFTHHRINFYGDDSRSGSTHGSVFAYFGSERAAFIREFQQFGAVVAKATA